MFFSSHNSKTYDFRSTGLNNQYTTEQEHKVGDNPYKGEESHDIIGRHVIVCICHGEHHMHHCAHHEILATQDELVPEPALGWGLTNSFVHAVFVKIITIYFNWIFKEV